MTYTTKSLEFRLRVRRDRVYLDGGLVLPPQASVVDFGENDLSTASCIINPSERIRLVCRSCCGSQWRSQQELLTLTDKNLIQNLSHILEET